jgi:hypothetical protein
MARLREDVIHFAVRRFLRDNGWLLIAGQYPDGSDDELPTLNIMDPIFARDNSPDPRRHSQNKIVPDLVSNKGNIILIIEMKSKYSPEDEQKLIGLLEERRDDLLVAMENLIRNQGINLIVPLRELSFVPCLAFGASSRYIKNPDFCYFRVRDLNSLKFEGNSIVSKI